MTGHGNPISQTLSWQCPEICRSNYPAYFASKVCDCENVLRLTWFFSSHIIVSCRFEADDRILGKNGSIDVAVLTPFHRENREENRKISH